MKSLDSSIALRAVWNSFNMSNAQEFAGLIHYIGHELGTLIHKDLCGYTIPC